MKLYKKIGKNLSILLNFTKLEELRIHGTNIEDYSAIFELPNLKELTIDKGALTEDELSATYFARAFLMPKNEFIKSGLENSFNNLCNFENVAEIFNVRIQAVIDRGRDLTLWE